MAVSVFCVQVFLYCMFSFSFPRSWSFPENSQTNGSKVKCQSINLFFCTTGALIMKDPYHTSIQISPCAYFVSATLFMSANAN